MLEVLTERFLSRRGNILAGGLEWRGCRVDVIDEITAQPQVLGSFQGPGKILLLEEADFSLQQTCAPMLKYD